MKPADLENVADVIAEVVKEARSELRSLIAAHEARLLAVEAQLAAGGARSLLEGYRGVWSDGCSYKRGELVTHRGGLWFVNRDTTSKPGSGSHFTLAVKSGDTR